MPTPTFHHPLMRERRFIALALTGFVHAALVLGWQMSRHASAPGAGTDPLDMRVQWVWTAPEAAPAWTPRQMEAPAPASAAAPAPAARTAPAARPRPAPPTASDKSPHAPAIDASAVPPSAAGASAAAPAQDAPPAAPPALPVYPGDPAPSAAPASAAEGPELLQRARRDAGAIDRALRKDSKPLIVAPPDSPQIRMRKGMETAHDLAPPAFWEAPKIQALVNNTGDGARRERVVTGNGTYCVTERSTATSIDMIEKHGKQMFTSCPRHETPAKPQEWRTARD